MIIDFHTHVWPDSLAERAIAASNKEGKYEFVGDGRVSSLIQMLDDSGVDAAVCLGLADKARNVAPTNRFAASLPERLTGFGSIHLDLSVEENLSSLRENGLLGVKIHPHFQGFSLDDPRLLELLDAMRGEYVVLTHVGGGGPHGTDQLASPAQVAKLARQLPGLAIVAAHFGGFHAIEESESELIGTDVYLDTSWPPGLISLDPGRVRSLIERHGASRVLFGSDWPNGRPDRDLAALESLKLDDSDFSLVVGGNAERLLNETANGGSRND